MFKDLGRGKFETTTDDIGLVKNQIFHTIDHLKSWAKDDVRDTPLILGMAKSYIRYEPLGVICIYSAWNYPIMLSLAPLVGVIASGNAAVLKPSELAPNVSRCLGKFIKSTLD